MDSGFFIFRDPSDQRVQGVSGKFHPVHDFFPGDQKCMLLHAWDASSETLRLTIGEHSVRKSDFENWLFALDPGNAPSTSEITQSGFAELIHKIRQKIDLGELEKAVAARSCFMLYDHKNILDAFYKACETYTSAFVYLLYHPVFGLWFGATPEILLNVEGENAMTMALAGTLKNQSEHWTGKEMEEQGVIGRYIEEVLLQNHTVFEKDAVTTTHAGPLRHLLTRYHFHPLHKRVPKILKDLHPTPAVGGYPRESALRFIESEENLDRQLYTGWLGWVEGDVLRTWVNLRCARIYADKALLYAGCGINSGSDAAKEWLETEAKMAVIGSCLA